MWKHSDWVKNLILFFDGIALLVPAYMRDRPSQSDPAVVAGLEEAGLLRILEPETFIDRDATEALVTAFTDIITSGALDQLPPTSEFDDISASRLGYEADPALAEMLVDELAGRGLAKPSTDGLSVPLHPLVRSLVLVLLAQILRPQGLKLGLDLSPATDRPEIQAALTDLLNLDPLPSAGNVVSHDLEIISVDLSSTPIEEILEFKAANGASFRAYARELRSFVHSLSGLPKDERGRALSDRAEALADHAKELREISRRRWKQPLAVGLGVAGAVWEISAGDVFGGALSLAGIVGAAAAAGGRREANPYSYLLRAEQHFST